MTTNDYDATASSPRQGDPLQWRIAVTMGSSPWLGRAMAIKFASAVARTICADLRSDVRPMAADKSPSTLIHELISETYKGDNVIFMRTDASDEEAIKVLIAKMAPR
jgi:NAD(P)-dependent dehydrogenase (short-subunit alcohol dehydrogenase family)